MLHDGKVFRVALLAAVVILAAGCLAAVSQALAAGESASPAPASSPATGEMQLKIGWMQEPDNLNPFIGYETSSYEIWSLQYDYLFRQYPDGTHGPELAAERPTAQNGGITDDGRVWTVKIRSGVKWQDGKPLTADDVAFTYNYIIEGGLWNWTMLTAGIDHVEAVDETTVRIVCKEPKADMLAAAIPIVPRHIWQDVKPGAAQNSYVNKVPIVGSGPFQVVEIRKGEYVRMQRNPDYWGQQPTVDEIIFQTYTNADTLVQELKLGTIDGAYDVPRASLPSVSHDATLDASVFNVLTLDYLAFNCYEGKSLGNPVLRDREFRRALASAIDRQKLVDIARGGLAEPGSTVINPNTSFDPDYHWQPPADQELAFSLDGARQMLDAAGYSDGDGDGVREGRDGKPITLRLWASADSQPGQSEAKLIAGWWKDIGIGVKLEVMDQGAIDDHFWNYEGATYVPDFDSFVGSGMAYSDPGQTLPWWTTDQIANWNEPCWSNAEYDELSAEQITIMDPQRRAETVWRMQEIMYEDAIYPVLAYPQTVEAYNVERWQGWAPLGFGSVNGSGPVFGTTYNVATYLSLQPAAKSTASDGTSKVWVAVVIVIACAAVGLVWYAIARRRRPRDEEVEA